MTDTAPLLELALACARGAAVILAHGRSEGFGAVTTKSSAVDIVTEVDRRSEAFIVERIRSQRPDDAILGEEGTDQVGTSSVQWVIDPLDGTVNFTYGLPMYAVSVGVEVAGVPTVGVVLNPATNEEFVAVKGSGATLNGAVISCRPESELALSLIATGFSYSAAERAQAAEVLNNVLPAVRDIRRAGSAALDLCAVACGRVDGYYEPVVNAWDISAASVIASEAGATVTGITDDFARQDVVAANPQLHAKLRTLVAKRDR